MFGTTMLLTVGLALDRAQTEGLTVRIAVAGEWLSGRITANDGQGVVLAEESGEICVIRADAVTAVRLTPNRIPNQPTPPD